ncbi:hypothetical protein HGP14_28665 [Rhizobium sp. P32RR-XVIII]|uniref:hypothetical protein n=1 Tax=Rhizobium sp. P32RR-XVIII TaxID=2726738 RepID=UPI0014571BDE|nr:hypothetical protein [Rhizobium sp. P32RR-XVIII]NLS07265.1 hypothetical protein [Rhizobium sp. P32RR-XVIII]
MNNNDAHRVYTDAVTAQLDERVTDLGRRQTDLEPEMRAGFKGIDAAVTALANETRASIAALSTNLAERNKPQWQALGVALTFAAMLGGLAYLPIREATSDLKRSVGILAEKMVTQSELEWRTQRSAEDRARTDGSVKELRDAEVPREELDRVFASYDQRFTDQQRQLDDVKQAQGNVYGARAILLDLREWIDRIERQRLSAGQTGPSQ